MSLDAHCHLEDPRLDAADALARAREAGVTGAILAGFGPERWPAQAALARSSPGLWTCHGLHPWRLVQGGEPARLLDELADFLDRADPAPVGLGELGLDRSPRMPPDSWPVQVEVFRAQLALARERDLPVVLHLVRADGAAWDLLRRDGLPRAGGMIHGFSGSVEMARNWLALGLHLSFGRLLGRAGRAVVEVPGERLLVETDAPDGAPEGPSALPRLARPLAALRGEEAGTLLARSEKNLRRLFRLG